MKILGVIPSRYASTRFEGKPLKNINGHPMIEWVYKRAEKADIDTLIVATDDKRIFETVEKFGGKVIMTSSEHENGTSRITEVINNPDYAKYDFAINIQGDEPLIDIESINLIANNYRKEKSEIITLKKEFQAGEDISNPNIVKVITDFNDNALYFSRSLIPYERYAVKDFKYYRHIGIYGYTLKFLKELKNLKEGILEKVESLEQLKFMENGYNIKVLETVSEVIGVDTPEDLIEVIEYINKKKITL
ncbi:3-deoxy-manno-octulosonate cytidylyltransferase [Leptotrichia sp. OH3620_COT-345]|uniref:3-deoxy-manno-octulosonate cytidylyltransferase n=1 Tax=Leptotrichia sp. OH3620_COT-345 TaxID=2491048 RepID=UPI000F65432D|nr:3-deoxy-manno-octulosonate cytidylyltransferase [Leptotrichia sp. OH3620_COT-345]RRD40481.1 3-deoxy-manno-octulosonate cytidylyltransferase [Leptotrichia sp. OH3620_COT-345]